LLLALVADLVKVGKPNVALRTLHTILTSKRYRTWTSVHEDILMLYVDLAVELRKNMKDVVIVAINDAP